MPTVTRRRLCTVWLLQVLFAGAVNAGEYNEVLSIGDRAPSWSALPGTDGRPHALEDWQDRAVLVVVFTCVSCPTAVDYESRLNVLAERAAAKDSRLGLAVLCVNRVPEDQLPALTERVQQQSLKFTYLYDESQQTAKDYGAIFTPECFVLDRDRRVIYMGALDDSTDVANVQVSYVNDAIAAGLQGARPKTTETIARGCRVRYARERRGGE
jgi:peroxiredoxin